MKSGELLHGTLAELRGGMRHYGQRNLALPLNWRSEKEGSSFGGGGTLQPMKGEGRDPEGVWASIPAPTIAVIPRSFSELEFELSKSKQKQRQLSVSYHAPIKTMTKPLFILAATKCEGGEGWELWREGS